MNLVCEILQSEFARRLTAEQKLGLQIEICPFDTLMPLDKAPYQFVFRGSAEACVQSRHSRTFYLVEDTWSNFQKFRSALLSAQTSHLGLVLNRTYPLFDESFSPEVLQGFRLHFPISEFETDPFYLLDEVFLFLHRVQIPLQGPDFYEIFNPAWKMNSPQKLQMESRFHSHLKLEDYPKAFFESPHLSSWRKRLSTSSKTKLMFWSLYLNPQNRRLDQDWEKSGLKYLWKKLVYWPLEYHWKTWRSPLTAEQYEKAQTQKINSLREQSFKKHHGL